MENSVINNLLGKHFSQEYLSPAENETLREWITNNQDEYKRLARLIGSVEKEKTFSVDTDKAWIDMNKKLTSIVRKKSIPMYALKTMAAAAVVAACFLVGTYLWTNFQNKATRIVADATSIKTVTLPDNSIITLNKNSSIQYDKRRFANHRNVVLEGEAFFEVTPDKKHPFEVCASSIKVRVLGTSFNIKARSSDDVCVNVKTGRVEVVAGEQKIVLTQGEEASWQDKDLKKQETFNPNYLSWKEQKLTFADTPLPEVFSMLEEYYGIRILVKEDIQEYRVTTVFTSESAEQALNELKLLLHFDCKKENDVYVISNFQPIR